MSQEQHQEKDLSAWKQSDATFIRAYSDVKTTADCRQSLENLSDESGWYQMTNSGVPAGHFHDLRIKKKGQMTQYGDFVTMDERLDEFFRMTTDMNDVKRGECIEHMKRMIASFVLATGEESGYVIVRTQKPCETEETFKPRWHVD